MLDRSHSAIIIDFGMAVKVARSRSSSSILPTRASTGWPCRCGKLLYMAPELFTPVHPVDIYAADLWACGIILFLLLTGMPPWDPGVGPTETDKRYQYVRDGRLGELLQVKGSMVVVVPLISIRRLLRGRSMSMPSRRRHPMMTRPKPSVAVCKAAVVGPRRRRTSPPLQP